MTHVLEVRLRGALLLGAGRSTEHHDATLRRPEGEPYIPASALKGAIREQLIRLTGEAEARLILGGRGFRQDLDPEEPSRAPEAAERVGGGLNGVYLGDADLEEAAQARFRKGLGYTVRAQVAMDRQSRRASDRRLYQREVVGSQGDALVFRAPVDASLLAGTQLDHFAAAVRAVFALGSSRSRGLGWVDLRLVPAAPNEAAQPTRGAVPEATELEIVLEALEPLSLGALPFVGNFQPTLDYLPASAVRGAVVTAAMRHRGIAEDLSHDPAFRALLLDPNTCVRFGDAVPAAVGGAARPQVAPLTARVGKYGREIAGVADRLVRDYVQDVLAGHGVYLALADEVTDGARKRDRGVRPRRWLDAASPNRRVMTRLALDSASARGLDGALYSVELLERGTRFVASVSNAGPAARQLVADAAAAGLRAGHGRGQGYGRLRIIEVRERACEPLRRRLDDFDAYLRGRLSAAALENGVEIALHPGSYLAALLVTELVPAHGSTGARAEEAFHAALGLPGSRLLHAEVRAGQRGGFDTTAGRPRPFGPVVQAGSVLLLGVPEFDGPALARLEALERHGAGEARDRGLGAVRFSDPIHLKGDPA